MPAPTLQAQGTQAISINAAIAVQLPAHQAGDILVLHLQFWGPNTAGDAAAIPVPTGWASSDGGLGQPAAANRDGWFRLFYLLATSSSMSSPSCSRGASWDTGTDTAFAGRAYVIRGAAPFILAADDYKVGGPRTAANGAFPAVTVSGTERLVIQFASMMNGTDGLGTAPAGWTAGTVDNDTTGTGARFQTFRKDNVSSSTSADASNAAAASVGAYAFFGISFSPSHSLLHHGRTARNTLLRR